MLDWINNNKFEVFVVVGICIDICVMDFVVIILLVCNYSLVFILKDVVVYDKGCVIFDMIVEMVVE